MIPRPSGLNSDRGPEDRTEAHFYLGRIARQEGHLDDAAMN